MSDQADNIDPDVAITITLKNPVKLGDSEPITALKFRPITGKDMRLMPVDDLRQVAPTMWMAGRLTGHIQEVTDKLTGSDLGRTMKIVKGFLESTQATGAEPSGS